MPTPTLETAEDLEAYIQIVSKLNASEDLVNPVWYRGTGAASHKLVPSLYRHPKVLEAEKLMELETSLIIRFRERAVPYLEAPLSSTWEYLFLMQHFGVPTRLLDWTENPLIGLFFALSSARKSEDTGLYTEPASVWMLKPARWNRSAFSHFSRYDGSVLSVNHKFLSQYVSDDKPEPPKFPAAIYGIHNSPRIVAQRGVFTIYGSDARPMEEIFEANDFSGESGILVKIEIPAEKIGAILKALLNMGYTDVVVFPDLEGLARETKRLFGFGV